MAWIKTISFEESDGKLHDLYKRVAGPDWNIDNVLMVHSLKPHTLEGHMALYKNVLHNSSNDIPKWFMEVIGVYVSFLNNCTYCADHHYAGMRRLIDNDSRSKKIWKALELNQPSDFFEGKELQALAYTSKLTTSPSLVTREDIEQLRKVKYNDGEILEINQIVSYFSYANRTVSGLGVNTDGDVLGLSPGDSKNSENWTHQ